jgi:ABC-2 type transport system ATP-binding protein
VLSGITGVGSVHAEGDGLAVELDGVERASLVAALVHADIGVRTVTALRRLEDAFLQLVGEEHARS